MKETKNVPQLRFSGFNDNWKEVIFSEIFTERHDISTITKDYPQLSFTIAEGVIRPEDRKTNQRDFLIKDKENKQYLKTELNDIIYNPANVVFGAIHRNGLGKGVLSPIYKIFYTNEDSVFLEGIVRNPEFIKKIANQTEGTVTKLKTLKPENFLQMRSFISPYLQEQQKIGSLLSHVESLIQAKTKKLESLKDVKKSLLQKCFPKADKKVPEIRFAGFSGNWEEKKIEDIANVYDGTHQTPKYQASGIRFLSVENIQNLETEKYISVSDFMKNFKIYPQKGDILMTRIGDIGTTNIYLSDEPIAFYVSLALLKPNNIDSLFLNYVIQSPFVQKELWLHTLHTAIPKKINKNEISLVKLLIPSSYKEQQKIGKFFSKYDSLISAQQKEIEKLQDIKKSLLQKMFV